MKRLDLLKRLGLGAIAIPLASSPIALSIEEDESFQFGQIEDGVLVKFTEAMKGKPSFDALKSAGKDGFNYVWRFIMRNGIRHSDGMGIRE